MLHTLFFVVTLAAAVFGAHLPPVLKLDGRIVGGTAATIQEAPYQISALLDSWGVGFYSHACGGSILNSRFIVTAAHCTEGTRSSRWRIRAGSTYHNSGGQVLRVKTILQHRDFNDIFDNDISLFKLSTHLSFGLTINSVGLPSQGETVADGTDAFVTGWGATEEGGDIPNNLQKLTLPIVNQEQCATAYDGFNPVTSNMICAGNLAEGGQDTCQGDSGGPLTVNGNLFGVTSWGNGCARPAYPGVYTRVPMYIDWINDRIN